MTEKHSAEHSKTACFGGKKFVCGVLICPFNNTGREIFLHDKDANFNLAHR